MKDLVMKRQNELEEIYRGVHMDLDSDSGRKILISLIDSGSNLPISLPHLFRLINLNVQYPANIKSYNSFTEQKCYHQVLAFQDDICNMV